MSNSKLLSWGQVPLETKVKIFWEAGLTSTGWEALLSMGGSPGGTSLRPRPASEISKEQLSVMEKLPCDMPTWFATFALSSNFLPSWTLNKSQTVHFLSCKDFLDLQQGSSLNSVCPAFVQLKHPISLLTSLSVSLLTSPAGSPSSTLPCAGCGGGCLRVSLGH